MELVINLTKIKNFTVKFLGWTIDYIPLLFEDFNPRKESTIINPKVIYYGDIKRHEVLFLILLSKLGSDVLYINTFSQGEYTLIDTNNSFSRIIDFPKKSPLKDFPIVKSVEKTTTQHQNKTIISNTNNTISKPIPNVKYKAPQNIVNTSLKTSTSLFEDFLSSINTRSGFVGMPMPIVPIYFYRYIGIKEKEEEYYNELYRLDKKLSKLDNRYIKFLDRIPVIANNDLINKTKDVWDKIKPFTIDKIDYLLALLVEANTFPKSNSHILNDSIPQAFKYALKLYLLDNENINVTRVKNFSLKVLMWLNEFVPTLFKDFDYSLTEKELYNPKILYYGDIKSHEVYFLILLSKIGCDILYINTYSHGEFALIDDQSSYSKVLELNKKSILKAFPETEVLIRQETEAFRASREISTVIYNEDDGLYKPWQFESYNVHPITLKTTYDELKILWNEESRMRPSFKIENKTVYVSNIFTMVSGVYKDIN